MVSDINGIWFDYLTTQSWRYMDDCGMRTLTSIAWRSLLRMGTSRPIQFHENHIETKHSTLPSPKHNCSNLYFSFLQRHILLKAIYGKNTDNVGFLNAEVWDRRGIFRKHTKDKPFARAVLEFISTYHSRWWSSERCSCSICVWFSFTYGNWTRLRFSIDTHLARSIEKALMDFVPPHQDQSVRGKHPASWIPPTVLSSSRRHPPEWWCLSQTIHPTVSPNHIKTSLYIDFYRPKHTTVIMVAILRCLYNEVVHLKFPIYKSSTLEKKMCSLNDKVW